MPPPLRLNTESASELDAHYATWLNEYNPTTPELRKLILQAATTEWLLRRLQRHADKILNPIFEREMANWTEAHHRQYQRTQRLLTAAETQLHRQRLKIWQHRQKLRTAARQQRQAVPHTQPTPPAMRADFAVRIVGNSVTIATPPPEDLCVRQRYRSASGPYINQKTPNRPEPTAYDKLPTQPTTPDRTFYSYDPLPHIFTGKERDAESGLDYFGARYYGSALGRFTSPDPLMASAHASNPQSWNRYAYTLNNPLRFVDPDGMDVPAACAQDKSCQIVVKVNVVYDSTVHGGMD